VRKPRDKAKVEQAVLLAERWIIAVLRHRTFRSLAELREAIQPLVEKLNTRKMKKLKRSRREIFEAIERPALKALPATSFEMTHWSKVKVDLDYHVEHDQHWYSVPYTLIGKQVEIRATERVVEVLHRGHRIASHARSHVSGAKTTLDEHMPHAHRAHADWTPSKILGWAKTIGPCTFGLVEKIFETRPHPEQGFKSALGFIRLAEDYPHDRLERACARALRGRTYSRKSVLAILRNNLDQVPDEDDPATAPSLPVHGNLRGSRYYH
jgi:transposase